MSLTFSPSHSKRSKLLLRWLYSCFLAVDANFRLKLKSRGISDPEIGSGWSYFVGNKEYSKHISQTTIETEVSPLGLFILTDRLIRSKDVGCGSDFHAVNQANSKSSKDYIASGVVACVCARHSLMQKNGVGDLQRGERCVPLRPVKCIRALTVPQLCKHRLYCCVCAERAHRPRRRHFV